MRHHHDHTIPIIKYGKLLFLVRSSLPAVSPETTPGEKLRYYRELHGLSQEQLGKLIGMTSWGIINYEKGFNPIYYEIAVKLGAILHVDSAEFMDEYTTFCMPGYGKRIKAIRALYGLSQVKFAEISGFPRYTTSMWEAEIYNHHPRREAYQRLKALAEAKGVNLHDT